MKDMKDPKMKKTLNTKNIVLKQWDIVQTNYGFMVDGLHYRRRDYAQSVMCKRNGTHTKKEWLDLCASFDFRCACCGSEVIGGIPCKDHIIPKKYTISSDSIENLQPLCRECNVRKGSKIINYKNG